MPFYPKFPEDAAMTMELVMKNMEQDSSYLDHSECPYSARVKEVFRKISLPSVAADIFEDKDDVEVFDAQVQKVLSDLEAMAGQMVNAETNEKIAYFKAKTTLIEKLINMKERIFNLREMNDFRNVVISGIEEMCTKDQVHEFMKRLDGILGTGDAK